MYLYIRNNAIIYKSKEIKQPIWFLQWCKIIEYSGDTTDVIREDGKVKKYVDSKQYEEDINKYHLQKELKEMKVKNAELLQIANKTIKQKMELDWKDWEPNKYYRKLYLIKSMKWSQHL